MIIHFVLSLDLERSEIATLITGGSMSVLSILVLMISCEIPVTRTPGVQLDEGMGSVSFSAAEVRSETIAPREGSLEWPEKEAVWEGPKESCEAFTTD